MARLESARPHLGILLIGGDADERFHATKTLSGKRGWGPHGVYLQDEWRIFPTLLNPMSRVWSSRSATTKGHGQSMAMRPIRVPWEATSSTRSSTSHLMYLDHDQDGQDRAASLTRSTRTRVPNACLDRLHRAKRLARQHADGAKWRVPAGICGRQRQRRPKT